MDQGALPRAIQPVLERGDRDDLLFGEHGGKTQDLKTQDTREEEEMMREVRFRGESSRSRLIEAIALGRAVGGIRLGHSDETGGQSGIEVVPAEGGQVLEAESFHQHCG